MLSYREGMGWGRMCPGMPGSKSRSGVQGLSHPISALLTSVFCLKVWELEVGALGVWAHFISSAFPGNGKP